MIHINTLTSWAKSAWNAIKATMDQEYVAKHRLADTPYYGNSASNMIRHLRLERHMALYGDQETAILPVTPAPTALPFPDWNDDDMLRWDDTDTELLAIAR